MHKNTSKKGFTSLKSWSLLLSTAFWLLWLSLLSRRFAKAHVAAQWIMAHHKKLPKGNSLYISKYPQEMSLNQIGSISLRRSLTKIEQLKLHKDIKTYDDIFVVQSLKFIMENGTIQTTLLSGNDIGPWFELDTVDGISLNPYTLIRLSRISDISLLSADDNSEVDLRESLLSAKPKRIYKIKPKVYYAWFKTLP